MYQPVPETATRVTASKTVKPAFVVPFKTMLEFPSIVSPEYGVSVTVFPFVAVFLMVTLKFAGKVDA